MPFEHVIEFLPYGIGFIGLYLLKTYFSGGICKSTARLDGKIVLVTGSNAGIGFETAREMSKRGAEVILACRNLKQANDCASFIRSETGNRVRVYHLDLSKLQSVRECARELLDNEPRIDILINNAGILATKRLVSEDGFELTMATNHFGPFLLTCLLLPLIGKSNYGRIVNVSSIAHNRATIDFDDINRSRTPGTTMEMYQQSKLANILFTRELARRVSRDPSTKHITTYSLHPGVVRTEIFRDFVSNVFLRTFLDALGWFFTKSCRQGAQTSIYCAVDESLAEASGKYYKDCVEVRPYPQAENDEDANRLWILSEKLTGLKE